MGALANQGKMMRPTLIRRIEDAGGQTVVDTVPRLERQVVSPYVASVLTDMMTGVTDEDGTAPEAAIDGQLVAGKTGTAQKADYVHGGYAEGRWVSSFVGYVPARKPRLVIGVIVDEPMIAHNGGTVAAPAFRRIAQASLRHLGVVADDPSLGEDLRTHRNAKSKPSSAAAAVAVAAPPAEPAPAPQAPIAGSERRVPSLLGQTARAAVIAAQRSDLLLALSGSGLVRTQQPEAGAVVAAGSTISILLEPPELAPSVTPGSESNDTQSNKTTAQAPRAERASDDDVDAPSSPPMLAVKEAGGHDG